MKRDEDGWDDCHLKFYESGRIFLRRHDHDAHVNRTAKALRDNLRPEPLRKNGTPSKYAVLTLWLKDHANFLVNGDPDLSPRADGYVGEHVLFDAAAKLGYPAAWRRGAVSYCVRRADYERLTGRMSERIESRKGVR